MKRIPPGIFSHSKLYKNRSRNDDVTDLNFEQSVTAPTPVGTSTYPLTITNLADGIDTLVQPKPPVGKLEIKAKWRVAEGQLREDVEIEGNFLTKR